MIWIMLWDVCENDMLLYLCDGFLRNVPCMIYPKRYVHYLSLLCFVCYPWPILIIWSLIAKFMGPTWGPPGAERTQVGPLFPWTLLSGILLCPAPSIHLYVPPSVCPSHPCYQSTTHNIQGILFIFGTAIDLCRSLVDYGASMFIFQDPVALWNFMNTLTDLLPGLGWLTVAVLWTVFIFLLL